LHADRIALLLVAAVTLPVTSSVTLSASVSRGTFSLFLWRKIVGHKSSTPKLKAATALGSHGVRVA
jgi:hypothetical protein